MFRAATWLCPLLVSLAVTACQDPGASTVGPAPLRRLSNSEYLGSLQDMFPTVHPTLPELPSDAIVAGFDNAAEAQRPTDLRIARFEEIANLYAAGATGTAEDVHRLTQCTDWTTPTRSLACATQFIENTGRRLFRRPLTAAERDRLTLRFQSWEAAVDFEAATRLTLSAMLQSPQFLYRPEPAATGTLPGWVSRVEPYALATRLSYLLWQSAPDETLLTAAEHDELRTSEQVRAQADRMLSDERSKRVYWDFHRQWLGLDRILGDEHTVRTPEVDPLWTTASPRSAWTETKLFIENTLFTTGSFSELLLSRRAWVNGEMARLYGVTSPADPLSYSEVQLPQGQRAGLLTRVAFLAAYSHRGATSPPVRGNALMLRVLCKSTASAPPGTDLSQPMPDPSMGPQTNRQLFEVRTAPTSCQGCHASLNGYGFGLEHYSASGAFQSTERGLSINSMGLFSRADIDRTFADGIDLSEGLSKSRTVGRCLVQQWFRYALGRAPVEGEIPLIDTLTDRFMANQGNERALVLDLVTLPAMLYRVTEEH